MFETQFRGLWIAYHVADYVPEVRYLPNGDPGYPAEGGNCEDWEVEDIDDPEEFVMALEDAWPAPARWRLGSRMVRWAVLLLFTHYTVLGRKDQSRMLRIANRLAAEQWDQDICRACEDHYWEVVGGPGGEPDYFYEG